MIRKFFGSGILTGFIDLLLIAFLIFDFGFDTVEGLKLYKVVVLPTILICLILFNCYSYWKHRHNQFKRKKNRAIIIVLFLIIIIDGIIVKMDTTSSLVDSFFSNRFIIEYGLLFYYFLRLMFFMRAIYNKFFNPAILFIGSVLILIISGAFLLLLPSATHSPINFTDALFTSTSAVCVTGLLVVDFAKEFTTFGQIVVLGLIQIGGLGMLTFTTFFAFFFKSGSSIKESLFMRDVLREGQLNSIMGMTVNIVIFSLFIEGIGAIFLYDSIRGVDVNSNHFFFAVFHAISAFCNAGFSTFSDSFTSPIVRHNYYLQWVIMGLITFGGLGYFIAFNFIKYLKQRVINLFSKRRTQSVARIITLNTKIVVYTTFLIIFIGTILLFISEYNTVLVNDISFFGKWTTSMFSVVTAGTCGFNTVDYAHFSTAGLLVMILIMWIGASPNSTGGGIKTSSFAIAILNIFSTAQDKSSIEIGTRRIAQDAVRRSFAIIMLSLICIGIGIILLSIIEPQFSFMEIAFEIFSAFGTVGLTMGITPDLSIAGKYIVIFMMIFGRIGMLNLIAGVVRSVHSGTYEYPEENISIN